MGQLSRDQLGSAGQTQTAGGGFCLAQSPFPPEEMGRSCSGSVHRTITPAPLPVPVQSSAQRGSCSGEEGARCRHILLHLSPAWEPPSAAISGQLLWVTPQAGLQLPRSGHHELAPGIPLTISHRVSQCEYPRYYSKLEKLPKHFEPLWPCLSVTDHSMKFLSLSKSDVHICTNVSKKKAKMTSSYPTESWTRSGIVHSNTKSVCGRVGTFFADHIQLPPKVIHTIRPVSEEPLEVYIYSGKYKVKAMKLIHIKCKHNVKQKDKEAWRDDSTTG